MTDQTADSIAIPPLGSDDVPGSFEPYEAPRAEAIGTGLIAVVPGVARSRLV